MSAADRTVSTAERAAEYGFDGNMTGLLGMTAAMVALLAAALLLALTGRGEAAAITALPGAFLATLFGFGLHTTRRGKFLVWAEILDGLSLTGGERLLDVGCGRGAVLTLFAKRLPHGRAVGIDLWTRDQSGNCAPATERNMVAEGVRARCELVTADMRSMPLADASFDMVVSSLAIHNIPGLAGRLQSIEEIARTLAPGGRVVIADLASTRAYARKLAALGFSNVQRRRLGWRFWWGPVFPATTLVTGTKPSDQAP